MRRAPPTTEQDAILPRCARLRKGAGRQRRYVVREQARPGDRARARAYEVIQSAKGKDLYSVRINQAYRAIVFHPSNSAVFVLTWVDHHDEAYRWAERKEFLVNPATGALQILTAEAKESMPSPAATPTAKAGLFAKAKTKYLVRLGVPEELLPVVQGVKTDAELEAIENPPRSPGAPSAPTQTRSSCHPASTAVPYLDRSMRSG